MLNVVFLTLVLGAVILLPRRGWCALPTIPAVSLVRKKSGKEAHLSVTRTGVWRLCQMPERQGCEFNPGAPVLILTSNGPGLYSVPLEYKGYSLFAFEQSGEKTLLAERLLPMAGGYNFRDLGGYPAAGGKLTRWGFFFRSDSLRHLSPVDLAYLASVPIVTLVDFRTKFEAKRSPDQIPASVRHHFSYPITPGTLEPGQNLLSLYENGVDDDFMRDVYKILVLGDEAITMYREFFHKIQSREYLPLLFHCSAGKDRTGIGAALLLFALGVDKQTVMEDYLASARLLAGKYDEVLLEHPERAALFTVKELYLRAAIAAIEKSAGSIEAYLTEILGVNIARMRELYLQ